ncbi:DUF2851 family protein [Pustulibacterium marinum]|nr:DUF2851 family protein [Pustulibacterium marinum]
MKEDFLHFLWRFKKLSLNNLKTSLGESVEIQKFGSYNTLAGPDFFNASLVIAGQHWVGNVEMHLKSSDWFAHGHEKDPNYNNVILHVVWEDDVEIFNANNQPVPTLLLKDYVSHDLLNSYQKFIYHSYSFINCENEITSVDDFILSNWKERLFIERLEQKSILIKELLSKSKNNWEAVLFQLLMKNFGGNINGESFLSIAQSFEFATFQKSTQSLKQLESLLFGQALLLTSEIPSSYEKSLQDEYKFLKSKFQLSNLGVLSPQFFKLRPPNFPTIRLSQLANLYASHSQIFSLLMTTTNRSDLQHVLKVSTSEFWNTHYTFSKESKRVKKTVSDAFINLIIINTIIPLQFCYQQSKGKLDTEILLKLAEEIPSEKNTVINNFSKLKIASNSAKDSQSLLQLYKQYCSKTRCLHCAVGTKLMKP